MKSLAALFELLVSGKHLIFEYELAWGCLVPGHDDSNLNLIPVELMIQLDVPMSPTHRVRFATSQVVRWRRLGAYISTLFLLAAPLVLLCGVTNTRTILYVGGYLYLLTYDNQHLAYRTSGSHTIA